MEQSDLHPTALAALVRRAQTGDRSAMESLYLESYPALWRTVCAMTQNDADALDVMQESYLIAFAHLEQLRSPRHFLPWLKRIAVNQLRQQLRKKQPLLFAELTPQTEAPLPEPADAQTPELLLEQREQAAVVKRALAALPDGQRIVLVLYYCEQYSVKEISQHLGVTQSTVRAQLHHGRKRLLQELHRLDGGRLLGLTPLPLLLGVLRGHGPAPTPPPLPDTPAVSLSETGSLTLKSARALLWPRLGAAAVALLVVGGLGYGAAQLAKAQHSYGDMQPPEEAELQAVVQAAEPAKPVPPQRVTEAPTEALTEAPTEPTAETPPAPPPTEAVPAATQAESTAAPDDGQNAANQAAPGDGETGAGDPSGQASGMLPTENPYPFSYQEITVPLGKTWVGSFPTDREWELTVFAHSDITATKNICYSGWSDGMQFVSIELNEPGVFIYSLRSSASAPWVRWVRITVTEDAD